MLFIVKYSSQIVIVTVSDRNQYQIIEVINKLFHIAKAKEMPDYKFRSICSISKLSNCKK